MVLAGQPDRNALINKFLIIEEWAYRGRHLVEVMNKEKLQTCCKRIRHDLEELEVILGIED